MTILQLQTFGTFAVKAGEKTITNFRSDKIRALLLYLAVESDRPHHREQLAALLWPELDRSAGLRNVRKSLFRLRQALGEEIAAQVLLTTRQTLAVDRATVDVDVHAMEDELRRLARHDHGSVADCPACMQRLEQALQRYRGEFLDGFTLADTTAFSDWVILQREQWHQRHLSALQTLTAAHIVRREWDAALKQGRRQLSIEPWREIAHAQLMQVYAGMGQPGEVRRQYDACRRQLLDELGVAPSATTVALFQQLVQAERAPVPPAGPSPTAARQIKLPRQFTSFVGRQTALREIDRRLDNNACALLTLLGPGGVGKTRLSIEAARRRAGRYRHGAIFVPLAPVAAVSDIPQAILDATDLPRIGKQITEAMVLDYFQEKEALLVLDNFEHLLDGADLVLEILHAAPAVQILITSRTALNLRAEWLYEVAGLQIPAGSPERDLNTYPAVQLFVERLTQVNRGGTLQPQDVDGIVQICRLVEGIPLAIELAASQSRRSSVGRVAGALTRSLDAIETDMRDVPRRHRSLRAVFNYSWQALDEREQQVLMHLSVFSGGFSIDAAVTVAEASPALLDGLQDRSFLHQSAVNRYEMHEVLRQYAREKAVAAGLEAGALERHRRFYFDFLSRQERSMVGRDGGMVMNRLQTDLANILQAWNNACASGDVGLLQQSQFAVSQLLHLRGLLAQGESAFERAVRGVRELLPAGAPDSPSHLLLAQLLNGMAHFLLNRGQVDGCEEKAREALALTRAGGFHQEEAHALMQLGIAHTDRGEYERAHSKHDLADDILARLLSQDGDDPWKTRNWRSSNHKQKSDAYWAIGDFDRAIKYIDQSLTLDVQNEDVRGEASCLHRKGIVARIQGNYDQALAFFEKSMSLARLAGYSRLQHLLKSSLALTYSDRGENQRAEAYFQEFLQVSQEAGDGVSQLTALINLGLVAARAGNYLQARAYYERGLNTAIQLDNQRNRGILLGNLGIIAMRLGDFNEAERLFAESLATRLAISDRPGEKYTRFYLARLALYREAYDTVLEESQRVLDLSDGGVVRDVDNLARTAMGHAYVKLGRLEQAAARYREAINSWKESGQAHLLPAPRCGMARIAMRQGDLKRAVALCTEIVAAAPDLNLESTFEPFDIWLTCIEVLDAAGDPQAPSVLHAAYRRLWEQAEQIPDSEIKARFLTAIPAHREIVRRFQAQNDA